MSILLYTSFSVHSSQRLRCTRGQMRFLMDLLTSFNSAGFSAPLNVRLQGFIRLVARIGSGDPVRVLRLYTTITLDEVCSIYCWDICTTCRYQSTCYSTCTSGPTALSVCSRLCLVANCSTKNWARLTDWLTYWPTVTDWLTDSRTVLYNAFYSYLCRRYWNGILGPSSPPLTGESFDTCSKAVAFTLADT